MNEQQLLNLLKYGMIFIGVIGITLLYKIWQVYNRRIRWHLAGFQGWPMKVIIFSLQSEGLVMRHDRAKWVTEDGLISIALMFEKAKIPKKAYSKFFFLNPDDGGGSTIIIYSPCKGEYSQFDVKLYEDAPDEEGNKILRSEFEPQISEEMKVSLVSVVKESDTRYKGIGGLFERYPMLMWGVVFTISLVAFAVFFDLMTGSATKIIDQVARSSVQGMTDAYLDSRFVAGLQKYFNASQMVVGGA